MISPIIIQVWREGKNILIREELYHVNVYGPTLREALHEFADAYSMATETQRGGIEE